MIAPRYLLDTNVIIDAARGRVPHAVARMARFAVGELVMSAVTLGELEHGWQGGRADREAAPFLALVPALPFDAAAARGYGAVMAASPRPPRGACDRLIAGHAHALGLPVVTSNRADFDRFALIAVEDWNQA